MKQDTWKTQAENLFWGRAVILGFERITDQVQFRQEFSNDKKC